MTSGNQHAPDSQPKRFHNKVPIYPPSAHYPYRPCSRRVFQPARPRSVRAGITSPITHKRQYLVLRIPFQSSSDLRGYLLIRKMHLGYSILWAFSNACSATMALGWINLSWFPLNCGYGTEWTTFHAYPASCFYVSAFGDVNYRDYRFYRPFGLRKDCCCSCCRTASLGNAVGYVFWSLAAPAKNTPSIGVSIGLSFG